MEGGGEKKHTHTQHLQQRSHAEQALFSLYCSHPLLVAAGPAAGAGAGAGTAATHAVAGGTAINRTDGARGQRLQEIKDNVAAQHGFVEELAVRGARDADERPAVLWREAVDDQLRAFLGHGVVLPANDLAHPSAYKEEERKKVRKEGRKRKRT